jgi:hypothetical protein
MDSKAAVTIVANGKHVRAYFFTDLGITLVRHSIATTLDCVLRPVFDPDTSFMDPVTSRSFPILWETRLQINYGNHPSTAISYVVKDEEIGFPLLIGMNAILALQGVLLVNGNEQMNPELKRIYWIQGRFWQPAYSFHLSPRNGQSRTKRLNPSRPSTVPWPLNQHNNYNIRNGRRKSRP